MGSNTYFGAYISCISTPKPVTRTVKGCEKCQTEAWDGSDNTSFCAKCGTKIEKYSRTVLQHPSYYDVLPGERLTGIGEEGRGKEKGPITLYFGSNLKGDSLHFDEETHIDLKNLDIAHEISTFVGKFAKEIEALESIYTEVKVSWGAHTYCYM